MTFFSLVKFYLVIPIKSNNKLFNIVIIQKYCDELNFYLNFTLLLVSFRMTTTSILNQLKKIKLFIKSVIKLTLNSFFFELKAQ